MKTLDEAFDTFSIDAWRLEARDIYRVDYEAAKFAAFLRDGTPPPPSEDWAELIAEAAARGARMSRIRLVGHPVTDYTRWEFLAYRNSVAAGEDVRIVDRSWLDHSWDAAPDVWVFDSTAAFIQHYDHDGTYLRAEQVEAAPYVALRNRLEPYAVPLTRYQLTDVPAPRPADTPLTMPTEISTTG